MHASQARFSAFIFFFQAEDGIRYLYVTGVQTCALPIFRQLEDAYQRLRSALLAQRRFVADASHELRTPLTTIRGNVGLLLKREDVSGEDRIAAPNAIAGESEA